MEGGALFWRGWLVIVSAGVVLGGAGLVVAPGVMRQAFSLLVFSSPGTIDGFSEVAVAYVTLVHGVLGAVMVSWGVVLLFILFGPFRRGSRWAWLTCSVSLAIWCLPDTAFSLWTGFWPSAILNTVIAILFAIPLVATYGTCRARGA